MPGWFSLPLVPLLAVLLSLFATGSSPAAPSMEELQVYVKKNPRNVRAVYYLGRLHAKKDDHGQAIRLFMYLLKRPRSANPAETVSPKMKVELLNRVALGYFKSGDYKRARKIWGIVLKKYPSNAFAKKGLKAVDKKLGGGGGASGGDAAEARPVIQQPTVSPEEAKKAYDEGKQWFEQGIKEIGKGDLDQARNYFGGSREKFETALKGQHEPIETNYLLGMSFIKEGTVDTYELEQSRDYFLEAYSMAPNDANWTPKITFGLASAYGLLDDIDNEILFYEKTIDFYDQRPDLQPGLKAEAHFRASLAYDKAQRADWSAKSFEHAKKAIKLDPNYKKKFQPMIRNSQVAKKVAGIIHEIIQKSEDSQIPDEEAARYAEEIGQILGDNNIKSEMLGEEGTSQESLKEMIKDPSKRQKLRQLWDRSAGGDPAKVQDMLDSASPTQKQQVDRFLSNDRNVKRIQQQLGNTKLQEVLNRQRE